MTLVRIPKGHLVSVSSYTSATLTTLAADISIEATLLPPVRVKLATVSKVDGSVRPCKQEPSAYIRGELLARYGTDDIDVLTVGVRGAPAPATREGNDITIEAMPWLAWWRTGNETRFCEIAGGIESYVECVLLTVDGVTPLDHSTSLLFAGGVTAAIRTADILGSAPSGDEGAVTLTLSVETAAALCWT